MFSAIIAFSLLLFIVGGALLYENVENKKISTIIVIGCIVLFVGTSVIGIAGLNHEVVTGVVWGIGGNSYVIENSTLTP